MTIVLLIVAVMIGALAGIALARSQNQRRSAAIQVLTSTVDRVVQSAKYFDSILEPESVSSSISDVQSIDRDFLKLVAERLVYGNVDLVSRSQQKHNRACCCI